MSEIELKVLLKKIKYNIYNICLIFFFVFNSKLEKCQKKERDIIKKALDPNINNKPRIRNTTSSEFQSFLKKSKDNLKNKPLKMKRNITTSVLVIRNKTESSAKKNKI